MFNNFKHHWEKRFAMKHKAKIAFISGLFSGVGVLAASALFAVNSSIPYTFEDGQVISADVLNDLFGSIRNTTVGFESASELTGSWSCTQYEVGGSATSGMPNSVFVKDASTGVWSASNTWTFSNSGTMLNATRYLVGTMSGANNTGICALNTGNSSYNYSVTLAEGYLLLGEKTMQASCVTPPVALQIQKVSPYKFKYLLSSGFGICTANNQPPAIPTKLAISSGTLSWEDNSSDETAFVVMKKSSGGSWAEYATVGSNTTTYKDGSSASGDKYRIKARNSSGDSLASNLVLNQ